MASRAAWTWRAEQGPLRRKVGLLGEFLGSRLDGAFRGLCRQSAPKRGDSMRGSTPGASRKRSVSPFWIPQRLSWCLWWWVTGRSWLVALPASDQQARPVDAGETGVPDPAAGGRDTSLWLSGDCGG